MACPYLLVLIQDFLVDRQGGLQQIYDVGDTVSQNARLKVIN